MIFACASKSTGVSFQGENMEDAVCEESTIYYEGSSEIRSLVQRFESCQLMPSEMTHGAHLSISVWYLSQFPSSEGTRRISENLIRFIGHYGLKGYNETITLFWIKLISRFLEGVDRSRSITDLANDLIGRFNNSQIIFDYYSRERLLSEEARIGWVEPDLKPLDF
jgi:hypothetical protein